MKLLIITVALCFLAVTAVEMWAHARGQGYKSGYSQCLGEQDDDKPDGQYRIGTK